MLTIHLLDSTAISVVVSAELETWDARPWDVAYFGITQMGADVDDFLTDADNIFFGLSWVDRTIESMSAKVSYVSGVDYDSDKALWGYAFWDTQSQQYSDNQFGSWGEVKFVENYNESAPVPEPATMLLFGVGLAGITAFKKAKNS